MARKITDLYDSIEGDSVQGQSRKKIFPRARVKKNGKYYFLFCTEFNIRSSLVTVLSDINEKIFPNSIHDDLDAELLADKVLIYATKKRYSENVTMGSSTHQANCWRFPSHTAVHIDKTHVEIENAKNKRSILQLKSK